MQDEHSAGLDYPWLQPAWRQLLMRWQQRSVPNALLLDGSKGLGKRALALAYAKFLLCSGKRQGADSACGRCENCHWFEAGAHPDFHLLTGEGKTERIKVDQVRELNAQLALTSHSGGYKVVVFAYAEQMNINAANSLLKLLEEPPGDSVFLLASHDAGSLPVTVRSRCQRLSLPLPGHDAAVQWLAAQQVPDAARYLALAGGAPLLAQHYAQEQAVETHDRLLQDLLQVTAAPASSIQVAERWKQQDLSSVFGWMLSWAVTLIKLQLGGAEIAAADRNTLAALSLLNNRVSLPLLFNVYDQLLRANKRLQQSANQQLLLESVLLSWAGAGR